MILSAFRVCLFVCFLFPVSALHTLVVGGGPVGLAAALTAARFGPTTVLEKRERKTRSIWFDVAAEPWGRGLATLLQDFGLDPKLFVLDKGVGTIMCRELELAMMEKCSERGIELVFRAWTPDFDMSPFDVIIAADGIRSSFRSHFGIPFQPIGGASQQSILLDFRTCPREAPNFDPGLGGERAIDGVSFVFRRFFSQDECHMQVLLSRPVNGTEIPWDTLLQVTRQALVDGPSSVPELQGHVLRSRMIDYQVRRVTANATFRIGAKQVGIIMGDALISAHFRLGIGLNNALNSLPDLASFLARWPPTLQQIAEKNAADLERTEAVASFQDEIIALETDPCSFILYFDEPTPDFDADVDDDLEFYDDSANLDPASYSKSFYLPTMVAFNSSTNAKLFERQARAVCSKLREERASKEDSVR